MAPQHPREVPHGFQPGVGRPPKPPIQIELGDGSRTLVPELSEGFFQQVRAVDASGSASRAPRGAPADPQ
jgi:hypothetical protein